MRSFVFLLLVGVAFAGCADAPQDDQPANDTSFDDVDVRAGEGTGVILGVVVDQTISPIMDVAVELNIPGNDPIVEVTDDQGRFAFSDVEPGVYFLKASKDLHEEIQFTATVEAGVVNPDPIRVQLVAFYTGDPFLVTIQQDGFFQCSQAGMPGYLYSSSPCHSQSGAVDLCDNGVCLAQERDFHADVADGWQTMVYEMTWKASFAGTSERMGVVFSTYKPERNTNHWFANHASDQPMRLQLNAGEIHPSAQEGSGPSGPIPAKGMTDMSYFVSVRPPADAVCVIYCAPPGFAIEQQFTTYLSQFYYAKAPEDWSIVAGDGDPF